MKGFNLNVISKKRKGEKQEIQGVIVQRMGNEFHFNYHTVKDPAPDELELLKDFRNHFVTELHKLNNALGHIPK